MEKVINNIRLLRKLNDFSQEYIAYELGLSQSQYSRRENGMIQFTLPEIVKLSLIFKVDYNNIIQDDVSTDFLENKKAKRIKKEMTHIENNNRYVVMTDFIVKTIDLIVQSEKDNDKKQFLIENLKSRIKDIEN